jgi:hypothetical protein
MRRFAPALLLAAVAGLVPAAPATAAYAVTIWFPDNASEFYSPFNGPATITFTFDGSEADATFALRIRPAGGSAIHSETAFVDADDPDGTHVKQFTWPALSVTSARTYEVIVSRNGTIVASESFQLKPRLVRITGASPNPFFPWIDDGYRDTTNVHFSLLQDANAEARIYRPKTTGRCCAASPSRTDNLGNLSGGANTWVWDGENDGGQTLAKGYYFAKIWADDGTAPPALSSPFKITISRSYRALDTAQKPGNNYSRTTESALVRGGDCFVHKMDGFLQIDCHGAKMTVYYRWGLGTDERIEKHGFVINDANNTCGLNRRKYGHTSHESFITVTDSVSGLTSCRVVTAKITYSFPQAS